MQDEAGTSPAMASDLEDPKQGPKQGPGEQHGGELRHTTRTPLELFMQIEKPKGRIGSHWLPPETDVGHWQCLGELQVACLVRMVAHTDYEPVCMAPAKVISIFLGKDVDGVQRVRSCMRSLERPAQCARHSGMTGRCRCRAASVCERARTLRGRQRQKAQKADRRRHVTGEAGSGRG
jgi:hypothetical protein